MKFPEKEYMIMIDVQQSKVMKTYQRNRERYSHRVTKWLRPRRPWGLNQVICP